MKQILPFLESKNLKKLFQFFLVLFFLLFIKPNLNAQNVTIPDAQFATWLQLHYPTCMNGSQLNTTCAGIINATSVNVDSMGIANLTGIEHFTSLQYLFCDSNHLTSLPALPNGLIRLECSENQLTSLPALPTSLEFLYCWRNQLTSLPALPANLYMMNCQNNPLLACLPILPDSLELIVLTPNTSVSCVPNKPIKVSTVTIGGLASYPICDSTNANGCIIAGISNEVVVDKNIVIYPNPSTGKFITKIENINIQKSTYTVEIYNTVGEKIYSAKLNQHTANDIDISNAPKGIYFAKIFNEEDVYSKKIVVQ